MPDKGMVILERFKYMKWFIVQNYIINRVILKAFNEKDKLCPGSQWIFFFINLN